MRHMIFSRFFLGRAIGLFMLLSLQACSGDESGDTGGKKAEPDKESFDNAKHPWIVDHAESLCIDALGSLVERPRGRIWASNDAALWQWSTRGTVARFLLDGKPVEAGATGSLFNKGRSTWAIVRGSALRFTESDTREWIESDQHFVALAPLDDDRAALITKAPESALWLRRAAGDLKRVELGTPTSKLGVRVKGVLALDERYLVRTVGGDPSPALWSIDADGSDAVLVQAETAVPSLSTIVADESQKLWAIASSSLLRSDDQGTTWQNVPLPKDFEPSTIATQGDTIVVANRWPTSVLISRNGGKDWSLEPIETGRDHAGQSVTSLLLTSGGTIVLGASCNALLHRRAPLEGF